ncbi:hypothetical protein GCM10009799_39220 [Nocardiopsis rhodophaea]|uniref:Uncharacterized protein n=1 Tax=Nocardiopsis rhodophaea TaxID=280238 RepID=A0ABP5ETY6_9ACTN
MVMGAHTPSGAESGSDTRRRIEKTPQAIREALLPEDVDAFDREFRRVMNEAKERRDLTAVFEFIDQWWVVALSSRDPAEHRRMMEIADRLNRGEPVHGTPASEIKAQIEAWLGR